MMEKKINTFEQGDLSPVEPKTREDFIAQDKARAKKILDKLLEDIRNRQEAGQAILNRR